MKTIARAVLAVILAGGIGWSQETNKQATPAAPAVAPPAAQASPAPKPQATPVLTENAVQSVAFQSQLFQRVFGLETRTEGVIPRMIRLGNPLQMINPFAPMEYGDGYDNLSVDHETGEGRIHLFLIRF